MARKMKGGTRKLTNEQGNAPFTKGDTTQQGFTKRFSRLPKAVVAAMKLS